MKAVPVYEIYPQDEVSTQTSNNLAGVYHDPVVERKLECKRSKVKAFGFKADLTEW